MAAPTAAPAVEYEWAPARTASPMPADAGPGPSTGGTDEPNDEPFGDIFFEDYGVNPFIDTEDDHSSTFAVDVDTASYQAARTPSGRFGSHTIRPEVVARPTGSRRSAADVGRASPFLPLGLHGDLRA